MLSRTSDSFVFVPMLLLLVFDMIVFASFGRGIRMQFGNRIIWWLYLVGALAGGLSMHFGMPNMPAVVPQVGADAPLAAMITFYGLLNLQSSVLLFLFPVKMWVKMLKNFRFY